MDGRAIVGLVLIGGAGFAVFELIRSGAIGGLLQAPLNLNTSTPDTSNLTTITTTPLQLTYDRGSAPPPVAVQPSGTQGVNNNNPGNIRYSASNNWQGQTGQHNGFVVFDTPTNGLRAMFRLLTNYIGSGTNTIAKIAAKWAPNNENNTAAYTSNLVAFSGIAPNVIISASDIGNMISLVGAIVQAENGAGTNSLYSWLEYAAGYAEA